MTTIMETPEEEPQEPKCVMCERGLAIFGILIGAGILAMAIHTLVMSLREGRDGS